jgi:hypothetical protein
MKKFFLVSLLLTSTTGIVHAETPRMINADGTGLSAICIAAVDSREAMYKKAAELGELPFEPSMLRCNGMTVTRFIHSYRAAAVPKPEGYVFSKSDDSPTTALCVAAVKSEEEYMAVKEQYFSDEANIEAEVHCNGVPLLTFARKYRAPGPTISLR